METSDMHVALLVSDFCEKHVKEISLYKKSLSMICGYFNDNDINKSFDRVRRAMRFVKNI